MKIGDKILVEEKQYRYFQDGDFRCYTTGVIIQVEVQQILSDGIHASQICARDGEVMTMRYWNIEIVTTGNI